MKFFCVRCCKRVKKPVEHRKPRGLGGSNSEGNIQPMCHECHTWKHANPRQALEEGFTIPAHEEERDYWIDFPHSRVR